VCLTKPKRRCKCRTSSPYECSNRRSFKQLLSAAPQAAPARNTRISMDFSITTTRSTRSAGRASVSAVRKEYCEAHFSERLGRYSLKLQRSISNHQTRRVASFSACFPHARLRHQHIPNWTGSGAPQIPSSFSGNILRNTDRARRVWYSEVTSNAECASTASMYLRISAASSTVESAVMGRTSVALPKAAKS
jgi:hypothetical protein